MNNLRKTINTIIKESLDNRTVSETLFNYYTSKKECEKGFFNLKIPVKKYGDQVIDKLIDIIMEEEEISEKSFSLVDQAIEKAKSMILNNDENIKIVAICNENSNRTKYCAEQIYSIYKINKQHLQEAKSEFKNLEKNKVPLTDDERKECFKQDAVWHYGYSKNPITGKKEKKVCAVWKSKNKDGDITYITNTHRAFNTAKSLQAAINKYHNFIKGTA